MTGWLRVVGLGAGKADWLTPEASSVLHEATDIVGYFPYVDAVPESVTATRHASDNGVEVERAAEALRMAVAGKKVAVVSGGDAGVFGMAAAVFEAVDNGVEEWSVIDIQVIPGITAMLAVAARVGAPLGHDFCVVSLSDYLKPWKVIETRLQKACEGDFVLALYNPASKTRRQQMITVLNILIAGRGGDTIVVLATAVGREDESVVVTTLDAVDVDTITMKTLLIVGSSRTRRVGQHVYTPRFYQEAE